MKKTLICITTCKRLLGLKTILPDYIAFCNHNPAYDFLVALDGNEKEYLDFFSQFKIPAIFSEAQEGVGLSKNRVLKTFPDYDYYFFIDDDVELLDPSIFDIHIDISGKTGIHHFSSGRKDRFFSKISETTVDCYTLSHTMYGSGAFNFFTAEGLKKVGGWHTEFAKYKRFGHTEHSYRFVNAGLALAPFNFIQEVENCIEVHNPAHVVSPVGYEIADNLIAKVEDDIIQQKLSFFPVQTLSTFKPNGYPTALRLKDWEYKSEMNTKDGLKKIQMNPYFTQTEKNHFMNLKYEILLEKYYKRETEIKRIYQSLSFKLIRFIINTLKSPFKAIKNLSNRAKGPY